MDRTKVLSVVISTLVVLLACSAAIAGEEVFSGYTSELVSGPALDVYENTIRIQPLSDGSLLAIRSSTAGSGRTAVTAIVLRGGAVTNSYSAAGWLKEVAPAQLGDSAPGSADEGQVFFVKPLPDGMRAAASIGWWTEAGKGRNGILELVAGVDSVLHATRLVVTRAKVRDVELVAEGVLAASLDSMAAKGAAGSPLLIQYRWDGTVAATFLRAPEGFKLEKARLRRSASGAIDFVDLSAAAQVKTILGPTGKPESSEPVTLAEARETESAQAAEPLGGGAWVVAISEKGPKGRETRLSCVVAGSETGSWTPGVPWNHVHVAASGRIQGIVFGPDGTRLESVACRCGSAAQTVAR